MLFCRLGSLHSEVEAAGVVEHLEGVVGASSVTRVLHSVVGDVAGVVLVGKSRLTLPHQPILL